MHLTSSDSYTLESKPFAISSQRADCTNMNFIMALTQFFSCMMLQEILEQIHPSLLFIHP